MAQGIFTDLFGTLRSYFKIGLTGVRLKNSSGNLLVRNNADSADAQVTTSQLNNSGDSIVLNSDAAGTGTDRLFIFSRNPAASAALEIQAPPAKGTDGYVLRQKAGTSAGVLEMELAAAASTDADDKADTTTLNFGTSSPVTMFTLPANAVVNEVRVTIDTAFDGTPTASVGISGTTSKYMGTGDMDLTMAAATVFSVHPGLTPVGTTEALIITYSAGSATAGSARFEVFYDVPS